MSAKDLNKSTAVSLWASGVTPFLALLVAAEAFHFGWLFRPCNTIGLDCIGNSLDNVGRVVEFLWFPVVIAGIAIAVLGAYKSFRQKDSGVIWAALAVVLSAGVSVALIYWYVNTGIYLLD